MTHDTEKLPPLPKSDRKFKAWLRALPAGKRLGAMSYNTCALGLFAKTIGAEPTVNKPEWAYRIEWALFDVTHRPELPKGSYKRVITVGKFRKYLGMREHVEKKT
jgi:hypothetical protein